MKNNDLVRVSELGGWSRGGATVDKQIRSDKKDQKNTSPSVPFLQDSAYESKVGLKEYLESLSRYKWHAFFFSVLVFVVGLLVWLQTYQVSFSANSSLLKKSFNSRTMIPTGISETWSRSIKGDVIYMRSDYVYNTARKITMCIANMTLEDREKYLRILEEEAVGESEVNPKNMAASNNSNGVDPESSSINKHWFAIDWETTQPITYEEAMNYANSDKKKDSLIIDGKQMRTLILNYWGADADKAEPKTALNLSILNNQNAALSKLNIGSDDESGLITTTVSDVNENIAVFFANLFPTAFIAANNRIVMSKSTRQLDYLDKLSADLKKQELEAKKVLDDAKEKYENELRVKDPDSFKQAPTDRNTKYAEALDYIAERKNELSVLKSETDYLLTHVEKYKVQLKILMNPYVKDLEYWKLERSVTGVDMKKDSPELQRIDSIIASLQAQSDKWLEDNSSKSIEELYNPNASNYYSSTIAYTNYTDGKAKIEKNTKQMEILNTQIAAREKLLVLLADKTGLEEVDEAQMDYDLAKEQNRNLTKQKQNSGYMTSNIPEMYQWNKTATKEKITARDTKYILIFIGFLSVLIGLIFARIADVLDTRIKTDLQVKEIAPYPILAHIPMLSSSERYITPDSKGTTMHRLAANLFGILGVNLRLNGQKQPDRTIAVTSSLPREGKSFVAFNLAAYYAIEGFKTCLLVADLRNPTLEPFPEIALTAKPGFLDYLDAKESTQPMPIEETIMKTYIENLHVIGPGTKKNINPTRLFDQDYFTAYLDELLTYFDTVIIDSPPLMPVVDSSLILKSVKSAIMVLNLGRVKKKDFEDTVRRLQLIDAPVNGLVINRDQYAVRRKYYAYYSSGYISGI